MNYYTQNKEVLKAMEDIFGQRFAKNSRVNFAVSYSQKRKLSWVIVQIDGVVYKGLILVYNNTLMLFDVLKYDRTHFRRYGLLSQLTPQISILKAFIAKNIPPYNPLANRQLKESANSDKTDFKVEQLKNQIEQLKNKNRSYRDEIQSLRNRITLMNKKNKSK